MVWHQERDLAVLAGAGVALGQPGYAAAVVATAAAV